MIKISHCLFAVLCLGSLFICSRQFTDSYIVPKWCFALFVLFVALIFVAFKMIFSKPDKEKQTDVSVYGFIIVLSCFLQAVLGIMQFSGLFQTSSHFEVTGSFENPAGFAACLCAGLPFIAFLSLENNHKYIRYAGWVAGGVMAVAIVLSQSRAAIVSIAVICITILCIKFFCKRWVKYLSFAGFVLLLTGCYWLKKDSADGRLLIWQCDVNMVKDAPWFGHGIGSFEAHYMDYQADYFRQSGQSRYSLLAGNVKRPFNEFLGILLIFGFCGLLVVFIMIALLVYCYWKYPCMEKIVALYSLASIGIFSLFSYPLTYPFTWVIIFVCVCILIKEYMVRILTLSVIKNVLCILVVLCSLGGIYKLAGYVKSEKEWGEASRLALCGAYDKALPLYEKLEITLDDNPYFLYNYAAILLENKQYEESLYTALRCRKYWADYDLELIIGESYQNLKKYELAEKYFNSASMMCPSRFLPLYKLFHLYKKIGDRNRILCVAGMIIDKPMKFKTPAIRMMKREVEREQARLLNEENDE